MKLVNRKPPSVPPQVEGEMLLVAKNTVLGSLNATAVEEVREQPPDSMVMPLY